jgi:enoyl-CoA hydratase/carnithine racemase
MSDAIRIERHEAVAAVTLDRPDARNALRVEDKLELARVIDQLAQAEVRAIVLTGSGDRAFCAGTDIKEMADFSVEEGMAMLAVEARMFESVLRAPIPIIAAVNGFALGAGCVLAYCCDLAVATAGATFGQPEVRNGVPAPVQAALLPQVIGLGRARWLLYTGSVLTADQACQAGLIGEVVAEDALSRGLEVARMVAQLPARGVRLQKEIVNGWIRMPFDGAVSSSIYVAGSAFVGDEPREAIRTFLERKK